MPVNLSQIASLLGWSDVRKKRETSDTLFVVVEAKSRFLGGLSPASE
jgi:hypothetical protein